jgi:hypothetical protein
VNQPHAAYDTQQTQIVEGLARRSQIAVTNFKIRNNAHPAVHAATAGASPRNARLSKRCESGSGTRAIKQSASINDSIAIKRPSQRLMAPQRAMSWPARDGGEIGFEETLRMLVHTRVYNAYKRKIKDYW